jgi:hypothetical protein
MADWLLIVPGEGEVIKHPNLEILASALRCPNPNKVNITEVEGTYFYSVAETADDPEVVIVNRDNGQKCAVVASALLTEREEFVRNIRSAGRNTSIDSSDGELLAHAVSLWGHKAWEKPGGEFSVASWMPGKKSILMATDGEGQRPAFWSQINKGFVASTRFEAMLSVPKISKEPDQNHLLLSLAALPPIPESEATWLKNVFELRPGHNLYFDNHIIKKWKWWNFPSDIPIWRPKDPTEAVEIFRHKLFKSVEDRIRGRNKVAISLTGGMDSTPVAAALVKIHEKSPHFKMKAFHAEYNPELNSQEADLTKEVADYLGLTLVKVPVNEYPTWPLMQKTHSWPPHHWYGQWDPFTKTISEYASSVLVGTRGEIFSRASLLDSLERGHLFDLFSAWISLKKLGINIKPHHKQIWQRNKKVFNSWKEEPIIPWIRQERYSDYITQHLHTFSNWEPPDTPKRLIFLHGFILQMRGMSHLFDFENRRVAMLDPYADRELLKLAASIEPVPWRLVKYLPRLSFKTMLPNSVITRRRTGTPWLFLNFFKSNSAKNFLNETYHPIVEEMIDINLWQNFAKKINHPKKTDPQNSPTGQAWFQPLVINGWLNQL